MSWVALREDLASMKKIVIPARKKHEMELRLIPPVLILWEFCSESKDIAFEANWTDHKSTSNVIHVLHRVKSHCLSQCGHFQARTPGTLRLSWDNSYSKLKKKTLYFRVFTVKGKTPTLLKYINYLDRDRMPIQTIHSLWEVAVEMYRQRSSPRKSSIARSAFHHALSALTSSQRTSLWLYDSRALFRYCKLPTNYYTDLLEKRSILPNVLLRGIKRDTSNEVLLTNMKLTKFQQESLERIVTALLIRIHTKCSDYRCIHLYKKSHGLPYIAGAILSAVTKPNRRPSNDFNTENENNGILKKVTLEQEDMAFLLCCAYMDRSPYYGENGVRNENALQIDSICVKKLIANQMPALHYHFLRHKVQIHWLVKPMLLVGFAQNLYQPVLHRLWDFLWMVPAPVGEMASVLSFFRYFETRFMKTNNYSEAMESLASAMYEWRRENGCKPEDLLEVVTTLQLQLSLRTDIELSRKSLINDSATKTTTVTTNNIDNTFATKQNEATLGRYAEYDSHKLLGEVNEDTVNGQGIVNNKDIANSDDAWKNTVMIPSLENAESRASVGSSNVAKNDVEDDDSTYYKGVPVGDDGWYKYFDAQVKEYYYSKPATTLGTKSASDDESVSYWEKDVWVKEKDENTQESFYWNWITKTSSWECPPCLVENAFSDEKDTVNERKNLDTNFVDGVVSDDDIDDIISEWNLNGENQEHLSARGSFNLNSEDKSNDILFILSKVKAKAEDALDGAKAVEKHLIRAQSLMRGKAVLQLALSPTKKTRKSTKSFNTNEKHDESDEHEIEHNSVESFFSDTFCNDENIAIGLHGLRVYTNAPNDLPMGWIETGDTNSDGEGSIYWYNPETEECRYEKPIPYTPRSMKRALKEGIIPNWSTYWDKESMSYYKMNRITGETKTIESQNILSNDDANSITSSSSSSSSDISHEKYLQILKLKQKKERLEQTQEGRNKMIQGRTSSIHRRKRLQRNKTNFGTTELIQCTENFS